MTSTSINRTTAGVLFGVTSSVAFGAGGPFAKALIEAGFSPLQAVWLRLIGAVLVLVGLCLVLRRPGPDQLWLRLIGAVLVLVGLCLVLRRPGQLTTMWRNRRSVVVYGLVVVASCQALYFVAASRLPVGIAILLEFTGPVLVVGWEKLVRHVHVPRESVLGVGVAMAGLAVVVQIWSGVRLDAVGLIAGLGAAAGNATYFLLIDRLSGTIDPLTLTTGGMVVGMVVASLAAPWAAPWHVLGDSVPLGSHHVPGWVLGGFIVLMSTVLAYLCGAAAIQRLSAPTAAGLAYVEPASATLVAWATLGERLSPTQLAGGAVVLAGAFLAQRGIASGHPDEEQSPAPILGTTVPSEALIP